MPRQLMARPEQPPTPFTYPGEVLLAQIDSVHVYHPRNQFMPQFLQFPNLNKQWLQKIRLTNMQNVEEFTATLVVSNYRILFLAAQS